MYISLTAHQIRKLHDPVLKAYGGVPGEKDPGLIDYISDKPFISFGGYEQYPGLFLKAAVYFHGIATGHYFNDGNKRTAVLSSLTFIVPSSFFLLQLIDII